MTAPSSDVAAIRQIIRALRAAGWSLDYVADGEENVRVSTEQQAIDAINAVDVATLFVTLDANGVGGYILFVLGNEPFEVAADYTTNLSPVLDPLTESWDS